MKANAEKAGILARTPGKGGRKRMALFTKDRSFYRSLILLAVPISLQNLVPLR